jgi:protein SCO1/2
MDNLKTVLVSFLIVLSLTSCKENKGKENELTYQCSMQCEGDKTYAESGTCSVCKMDLKAVEAKHSEVHSVSTEGISDESIFNLTSKWHTEEGKEIELKDLKEKPLVMVMIYTTCRAACPRLVADMKSIQTKISEQGSNDINYVLISIDPKNDTPKRLKQFAIDNGMDGEQWTFLQGTESSVREFSNVLAVKYKQISPIDFSHSNIISVFDTKGEMTHQQEGLGVDNKETIKAISELVN